MVESVRVCVCGFEPHNSVKVSRCLISVPIICYSFSSHPYIVQKIYDFAGKFLKSSSLLFSIVGYGLNKHHNKVWSILTMPTMIFWPLPYWRIAKSATKTWLGFMNPLKCAQWPHLQYNVQLTKQNVVKMLTFREIRKNCPILFRNKFRWHIEKLLTFKQSIYCSSQMAYKSKRANDVVQMRQIWRLNHKIPMPFISVVCLQVDAESIVWYQCSLYTLIAIERNEIFDS